MQVNYEPIGIIRSPHLTKKGVPIQSSGAEGCHGSVILEEQFVEGLQDLEGFSHLILIYHFHRCYDKLSRNRLPDLETIVNVQGNAVHQLL